MRRQLIIAMVGVVAGALLIAGVGTYLLANRGARADAARGLLQDARKAKNDIPTLLNVDSLKLRRDLLAVVQSAAGARLVLLTSAGVLTGGLPPQVSAQDLQPQRLAAGVSVSGVTGDTAYAALPLSGVSVARVYPNLGTASATSTVVLVVVRDYRGAGLGGRYLLLVSGITLLAASLVAWLLGRRITRPLAASVGAIGKIAHGDLTVRVPHDGTRYPELSSLAESINTMTANLSRGRESERQFLLSVSHELRTPLTSI
ncbi:MAG: HAMP domain-containing protein, partial [Acidimicrobiales bacterium]